MAKILLMNFDEEPGGRLEAFLRTQCHDLSMASPGQSYLGWLRGKQDGADLVIVDVSHNEKYFWRLLKEIAALRAHHGPCPMILCVSRVYRGAQFELDLERKGARVLHI